MDQIKQLQYKIDSIRSLTINESDEKWNEIIDALNSRIVLEQERALRAECTATKTVQGERAHCSTRLNDMRDKHRKQMQSSHKIRKDQADCVVQLNKDFQLANIDLDFHEDVLPSSLKLLLHETVYKLIQEKFMEYLNLLYIIDVSESQVKALDGDDVLKLSEDVSFLKLKREWQKVWFKNKYS